MRLKLIILFILATILCSGQDTLQQKIISQLPKNHPKKSKKKRKEVTTYKLEAAPANITQSSAANSHNGLIVFVVLLIFAIALIRFSDSDSPEKKTENADHSKNTNSISDVQLRNILSRRNYYRNVYLKSEEWKRKRYVVFKRDNWLCVYCGAPATQVHHKRYAKKNIGKEPIEWLISLCRSCHERQHIILKTSA